MIHEVLSLIWSLEVKRPEVEIEQTRTWPWKSLRFDIGENLEAQKKVVENDHNYLLKGLVRRTTCLKLLNEKNTLFSETYGNFKQPKVTLVIIFWAVISVFAENNWL